MSDLEPRRIHGILDLRATGTDRWEAPTPAEGPPRLFGGQVASQTLRAATLTVGDDRRTHSLHSYFIRPGRPGTPLELAVERTRDGRSFSTRRVTAIQQGEAIFVLDASFHTDEGGDDWQAEGLPEGTPSPDALADRAASAFGSAPGPGSDFRRSIPFEILPIRPVTGFAMHPCWVRLREEIDPDDWSMHQAALTFVSDLAVIGSARAPGSTAGFGGASLDHAVWFHRPVRVDQWLLFSVDPVTNFGARGLARGTFQREDGTLVASLAQECLLRPASPIPPP
ncbi:MAG TPA: acyl-CoA thioesterase domain-containing protein [Acidimicrobiales bacterium]|nr:acyl-CoA thioesterase domain-containing protein [Acidimicrobiales bacterium]